MKIVEPSVELVNAPEYSVLLNTVETCGRVCYKSEDKMSEDSSEQFIKRLLSVGHESVIEHTNLTVKFVCDRGVSHEIVRHRIASYSQESTRYCNYSKDKFGNEITVILPVWFKDEKSSMRYILWYKACEYAECMYFELLNQGCTPQEARAVLPNSLKTELCMTANIREWRHFLRLRCSDRAHPQMREVAQMLGKLLKQKYPVFFDDLEIGI